MARGITQSSGEHARRPTRWLGWLEAQFPRYDARAYLVWAAICTAFAASLFYGSMIQQTRGSWTAPGEWSAPLDDVFIHFDYARATARGYPFEWTEGNGFSSGNTSLAYPFVLAFGYWIGFQGLSLVAWGAIVAIVSVVGLFWATRRVTEPLGRWAKYFIPPVVLSMGALDWTLFSGMENAFHLAMWGLLLTAALRTQREIAEADTLSPIRRWAWLTGLAGALAFVTRPESVVCAATFGIYLATLSARRTGWRGGVGTLLRVGLPGAIAFVAQALANRTLTGETSANGAIAKLALNNPYMASSDKWDQYAFLIEYVVKRNTEYHFADNEHTGWLVVAVAVIPLFFKPLRPIAILLWIQIAGWLLLVALNGQVRWQNERYTMAAVFWLLLLCAMGIAAMVQRLREDRRGVISQGVRVAIVVALCCVYWVKQAPRFRDQVWFYGRACRNIYDQHITAGRFLKKIQPERILVGDAGALLYMADRPGLDLIGLGGYHDYPFARAGVHGLGASLELIERMPPAERPDVMAIYPTWWGDLPVLFGEPLKSFPVAGNVICGGFEKVIYRARWSTLDRTGKPRSLGPDEMVFDEVDVADLLSEREHGYVFPQPKMGFVQHRILPDPTDQRRGLFDAGRIIPKLQVERAVVRPPSKGGRIIFRTTSEQRATLEVILDNALIATLELDSEGHDGWHEVGAPIPEGLAEEVELVVRPIEGSWVNHHVWLVGPSSDSGVARGE